MKYLYLERNLEDTSFVYYSMTACVGFRKLNQPKANNKRRKIADKNES